jgi:hypothetical protein
MSSYTLGWPGMVVHPQQLGLAFGAPFGVGAFYPVASLAAFGPRSHAPGMFVVTEAEATAIRTTFDQGGEFAAAVELRRLFPGITDTVQARECARAVADWKPLPVPLRRGRQPRERR